MFNSLYFSDGPNYSNILKLKTIKNDISVSINILNNKDFFKIKNIFSNSKILILSSGEISFENILNEETIKLASSSIENIKVSTIDDLNYAKKIQFWGVNLIGTKSIPSFLIENDKEEPIIVKCMPFDDDHSECEIEDYIILRDNEIYNIYYSENIYNLSQNINQEPLGEFEYIDTNILDELYYKINNLNFDLGIINLNLSHILQKGEEIYGIVGPDYDDVPECYQYNFFCEGQNSHTVDCKIKKDEEEKIEIKGDYRIYSLEDYSLNEYETEERTSPEESYIEYITDEKKRPYIVIICIFIVIIICLVIAYFIKFRKNTEVYGRIRIEDNNYLSDNYLYR